MSYRMSLKHRRQLSALKDPVLLNLGVRCETEAEFLDAAIDALCDAVEDRQRYALGLLKVGASVVGITDAIKEAVPLPAEAA